MKEKSENYQNEIKKVKEENLSFQDKVNILKEENIIKQEQIEKLKEEINYLMKMMKENKIMIQLKHYNF